ncbi:HD domain-containing protein [Candidatus Woesearchaeota archaeon]|nr:HD domain-containing protein [Candidatus Woesearchaeota archaeon]
MLKKFDDEWSRGRREKDKEDMKLPKFILDYKRIIQSQAYSRLAHKSQLLCPPETRDIRTTEDHTKEVIEISTTISKALGLNTHLCRAIAAAHDIGHGPYRHLGEVVFSELNGEHKPFSHLVFGVVVAQEIDRLNLNYETLEGVLFHSRKDGKIIPPAGKPQEYAGVMYADKLAFTSSDLDDAIQYGYLTPEEIPADINELGPDRETRVKTCIDALVEESKEKGYVSFSQGRIFEVFNGLRSFLYENVYSRVDFSSHKDVLRKAHKFFSENPEFKGIDPVVILALLTDKELQELETQMLSATIKPNIDKISHFGVFKMLPFLKEVDYSVADLSWGKEK